MTRAVLLSVALGVLVAGCSSTEPAPASNSASAAAAPARSSTASTVVGTVAGAPAGIPVIVVLDPKTPRDFAAPAEKPVMDQASQTFGPALLLVRTNAPVEFRNSDDTLHNVHVTHEDTKEPQFNVAIPTGETFSFTFKRDGFYHVGCDIHPAMSAEIFAAASPYVAVAEADGRFQLDDVPPGSYVATAYAGSRKLKRDVEVAAGTTTIGIE